MTNSKFHDSTYALRVRILETDGEGMTTSDAQGCADAEDQMKRALPADPDDQNDSRADSAAHAVLAFADATGTDADCAIEDLLCNLRHLTDRIGGKDFAYIVACAMANYSMEIGK